MMIFSGMYISQKIQLLDLQRWIASLLRSHLQGVCCWHHMIQHNVSKIIIMVTS